MEETEQPYLAHTRDDVRKRRKVYYADEKDVAWMSGLQFIQYKCNVEILLRNTYTYNIPWTVFKWAYVALFVSYHG